MYRYIFMQIRRSLLLNVLFCLLLATAGVLLCLGTGLLVSARNGISALDDHFTTIALPETDLVRRQATYIMETQGTGLYDTGQGLLSSSDLVWGHTYNGRAIDYITDDILNSLKDSVYSSGALETAPRRTFGAYSPDIIPVYYTDRNQPVAGSAGHSAAFIGVCNEVLETQKLDSYIDPETGTPVHYLKTVAYISFAIEQELVYDSEVAEGRSPGFGKNTGVVWTRVDFRDPDGGYFFVPGERYFLSGTDYKPQYMLWTFEEPERFVLPEDGMVAFIQIPLALDDNMVRTVTGSHMTRDSLCTRMYWRLTIDLHKKLTEEVFPLDVIEDVYYGEVDTRYSFKLDSGDDWSAAIEVANKRAYPLNIITADNLSSFLQFNQNLAEIVSGRNFSKDETGAGVRVCIIPKELAQKNELEVGDTITLSVFETGYPSVELYDTSFMYCDYYNDKDWDYKNDRPTSWIGARRSGFRAWMPSRYEYGAREAGPIEFEIVGIYSAPRPLKSDPHNIPLNTVFIPEKSFEGFPGEPGNSQHDAGLSAARRFTASPDTVGRQRSESPLLNMIVLPNGGGDEFERLIKELTPEYSHLFRVYDQGYSIVRPVFDTLLRYSVLIFVICAAVWVAAIMLFCFFYVLRRKKEAGILYALGIDGKRRFRWVAIQCAILVIVAQATAFGVSASLYQDVLDNAMEAVQGMNIVESPDRSALLNGEPDVSQDFSAGIAGDERAQQSMILSAAPLVMPLCAGLGTAVLLLTAGGISRRISRQGVKS